MHVDAEGAFAGEVVDTAASDAAEPEPEQVPAAASEPSGGADEGSAAPAKAPAAESDPAAEQGEAADGDETAAKDAAVPTAASDGIAGSSQPDASDELSAEEEGGILEEYADDGKEGSEDDDAADAAAAVPEPKKPQVSLSHRWSPKYLALVSAITAIMCVCGVCEAASSAHAQRSKSMDMPMHRVGRKSRWSRTRCPPRAPSLCTTIGSAARRSRAGKLLLCRCHQSMLGAKRCC